MCFMKHTFPSLDIAVVIKIFYYLIKSNVNVNLNLYESLITMNVSNVRDSTHKHTTSVLQFHL